MPTIAHSKSFTGVSPVQNLPMAPMKVPMTQKRIFRNFSCISGVGGPTTCIGPPMGIMVIRTTAAIRLDSAGVLVLSTAQLVFGCAVWMEDPLKIPLFLHAMCDLMEIFKPWKGSFGVTRVTVTRLGHEGNPGNPKTHQWLTDSGCCAHQTESSTAFYCILLHLSAKGNYIHCYYMLLLYTY